MASVREAVDTLRVVLHDRSELSLPELYAGLGDVEELIRLTQALTDRLHRRVEELVEAPGLRVDEVGEPADPTDLVEGAARSMAETGACLAEAGRRVSGAWSKVGRLYVREDALPEADDRRIQRGSSPQPGVTGSLPGSVYRRPPRRPGPSPSM